MARSCELCGKRPLVGNTVARRGRAKKQGGGGSRVVKRSRRKQYPNLQTARINLNGHVARVHVCTKCLRRHRAMS